MILVVPGDRDASLLYRKIDGTDFGSQMPLIGGPLSPEQIETIGIWIDEGALNN